MKSIGKEVGEEMVESQWNGEYTVCSAIFKETETQTTISMYFQTSALPLPAHTATEFFWSLIVHDLARVTQSS